MAVKHTDLFNDDGKIVADNIPAQDMIGWVGQGPISDRTQEHLASSDKGVVLYRKMLMEQMERVERGEEPMAVIRDRQRERADDQHPPRAARLAGLPVAIHEHFRAGRSDHRQRRTLT